MSPAQLSLRTILLCDYALTGQDGKIVSLKDTIRGFKGIIGGEFDALPEQAFYMVGPIDEAVAKAKTLQ